jgi:hypothetical protein
VHTTVVEIADWSTSVVEAMDEIGVTAAFAANIVVCRYDLIRISVRKEGEIFWVYRTQAAVKFSREPYVDLEAAIQDVRDRLAAYVERWTAKKADILLMSVDRNRRKVTGIGRPVSFR